jgi:hypothetical protein
MSLVEFLSAVFDGQVSTEWRLPALSAGFT